MKIKQIFLITIFTILLMTSVSAQLTYVGLTDAGMSSAGNVLGMATIEDKLYVTMFIPSNPTRLYIINSSMGVDSYTNLGFYGGVSASDGTYLYVLETSTSKFKKLNATTRAVISERTTGGFIGAGYESPYFLLNRGDGTLDYYNYDTDTIVKTISDTGGKGVASNGDNIYVQANAYTTQYDSYGNIVEAPSDIVGLPSGGDYRELEEFGDYYYILNVNANRYKLYRLNSTPEITSNYIYINGNYYSDVQCVKDFAVPYSYTLCNDTRLIEYGDGSVGYQCNSPSAETDCSGLCLTSTQVINGSNYISGACDPSDCEVECYTIGESVSTGLTTYKICGQYDDDVCLEYGSVQTCPSGSYYTETGLGYCTTYNYSSFNNTFLNSDWYVSINEESVVQTFEELDLKTIVNTYLAGINLISSYSPLVSDDNEYFKSRYLARAYDVYSELNLAYVNLGIVYPNLIGESGYASIDCNHKETPIIESDETTTLNTTRTITTDLRGSIITTSLTYTLNDSSDMRQTMYRVSPSLKHVVDLNVTNRTMLVYSNSELIFNQTTANDIEVVNLYCDYDFVNLYRNCYVFISDGSNDYEVFETPVSFSGESAPASTYYELKVNGSISVTGYGLINQYVRQGFESFTEGTYPFSCQIIEGGQVIRVYQNNGLIPSYLDYQDIYLNADLNAILTEESSNKDPFTGGDLTDSRKMLYALLITFILAIVSMMFFLKEGYASQSIGFVGGGLMVGGLIFFTAIEWLPFYITLLIMIVAGGISAVLFRKGVMGA